MPIDHERHAPGKYAEGLLHAVELADAAALVAEQGERQTVFRREMAVRFAGIIADANDRRARCAEFFEVVAKSAGFDRAAAGVVFWVEVDHHVPATIFAQA